MKSIQNRLITFLTTLSFLLVASFPGTTLSAQVNKNTLKERALKQGLASYKLLKLAQSKKGIGMVFKTFESLIPEAEKPALISSFKGVGSLPSAELQGNKLLFTHPSVKESVSLEISNASQGIFKINGFEFQYNPKKSFKSNLEQITTLIQQKKVGHMKRMFHVLSELILPSAHADRYDDDYYEERRGINWLGVGVIAALGFGLYALFSKSSKKDLEKTNEALAEAKRNNSRLIAEMRSLQREVRSLQTHYFNQTFQGTGSGTSTPTQTPFIAPTHNGLS